jgi:hypothetical protein
MKSFIILIVIRFLLKIKGKMAASSSEHNWDRIKHLITFLEEYTDTFCMFKICKTDEEIDKKMKELKRLLQIYVDTSSGQPHDPNLKLSENIQLYIHRFISIHSVVQKYARDEIVESKVVKSATKKTDIIDGVHIHDKSNYNTIFPKTEVSFPSSSNALNITFTTPSIVELCPSSSNNNSSDQIPSIESSYHELCVLFKREYNIDINEIIDGIDPIMHIIVPFYHALRNMLCFMLDLYNHYRFFSADQSLNIQDDFMHVKKQFKFTMLFTKTMLVYLKEKTQIIDVNFSQKKHDDNMKEIIDHLKSSVYYYDGIISKPISLFAMFMPTVLTPLDVENMQHLKFMSFETLEKTIIENGKYITFLDNVHAKKDMYNVVMRAFFISVF